jgi:HEAT repeat protein
MDESILVAHVVSGINDANQEVNAAAVAIAPVFGDSDIMNALVGRFGKEPYGNKGKAMEAFLKISYGITEGSGAILQMPSRKKHKISTGKHGYSQEPIIIIAPQAPPRKSIKTLAIGGKHIVESKQESTQNTGNDTIGTHSQKSAVEILLIRFPSLNVEGKVTALQTLDKLSDPRIRTFAISLVDDQNPRVRSNAITLATKFGTEDILPRLFISVQDKDPGVRYTTIQVLLAAKNLPEEYSLLRLSESTDPRVRDSLASAIGQNGFRQDLNELMLRMLDDNDPKVRLKVAQYFVNNHDKRSIDKLAKMLATDGMCSQAAYALAAQGDMRGNDALLEIGKGHCDTNNNMDNSSKRLYAVMALRKQKDPRVVQLICELLEEGKGDDYQLILNLGETRDKSAAPCLVSYGKKRKYGREVMLSLAKIASPEALDYLKESLDYTYQYDSDVVENAINAISATPGTRSVDILIEEFLKNKRYTNNILQGLGNRARWDISALSNIFKAAGNDQNNLGKIPFDIGLRAGDILMQRKIMGLTNDKDMDVRKGAIIALGALYDNSSLSLLEKLALENNVEIRVLANKALELRHNRSKK